MPIVEDPDITMTLMASPFVKMEENQVRLHMDLCDMRRSLTAGSSGC
jgi:hypothetical protein